MSSDYFASIFKPFFQKHPETYQKLQECPEKLIASCTSQSDIQNAHGALEALVFTLNIFKKWTKKITNTPCLSGSGCIHMGQVTDLLQFLRSTRDPFWFLHLASFESMFVCFSA